MGNLIKVCPLCKKESEFQEVLLLENVFASGDIFEFNPTSKIGAEDYAKGDCTMDMRQCLECGFIYNFAFDMSKMLQVYTSNAYYQQKYFTQRLSKTLTQTKDKIMQYASKDSVFLEIAPGLCDLLCALASEAKFVYSIDPSPTTMEKMPKNVSHIQGFFDTKLLRNSLKHKVDFIVFRHLLEHIEKPREFLEEVVGFLDIGGKMYVDVLNAL
ncbi:methyltransferase domain-containing protein, partial [Helicobacter sp.]|uniref:class I SAM-dependent methyltransferase n=1 Tax=Helicobacter sp. TaxID=218 RepID=UPI001989A700